jgi:hypothetical protein
MAALREKPDERTTQVPSIVQSRIDESARKEFTLLVDRGCDRKYLLDLLAYLVRCDTTFDTHERLTAFPTKTRMTALKRMRQCAEDIERLNRSRVSQFGRNEPLLVQSDGSSAFDSLPGQLRAMADCVERLSRKLPPRKHLHQRLAKALLVSHVTLQIKKPCDQRVASLISAALDKADYDAVRHRQWRRANAALIERVSTKFKDLRYLPKMN